MKKSLITLIALTLTSSAFAATTGTLNLKGTVAQALSISVNGDASALNLDLHNPKVKDLKVASVLEQSNSKTGYKVSISSQNKGILAHEDGKNVDSLGYSMKYGTQTVDFSKTDVISQGKADAYNVSKDVKVSYDGREATDMVAGEYRDTITFSISAN